MRRFPELRPVLWDGLVVTAVILLAVFCGMTFWGSYGGSDQLTVVISVDGEEVERCAMEDFPDTEQLYRNNGYTLRVLLSADRTGIRVREADCLTQDCVHTGEISRGGQSIVCLPARIIVQLEGGFKSNSAPDLVIG